MQNISRSNLDINFKPYSVGNYRFINTKLNLILAIWHSYSHDCLLYTVRCLNDSMIQYCPNGWAYHRGPNGRVQKVQFSHIHKNKFTVKRSIPNGYADSQWRGQKSKLWIWLVGLFVLHVHKLKPSGNIIRNFDFFLRYRSFDYTIRIWWVTSCNDGVSTVCGV